MLVKLAATTAAALWALGTAKQPWLRAQRHTWHGYGHWHALAKGSATHRIGSCLVLRFDRMRAMALGTSSFARVPDCHTGTARVLQFDKLSELVRTSCFCESPTAQPMAPLMPVRVLLGAKRAA
jgi:hypothetical protein